MLPPDNVYTHYNFVYQDKRNTCLSMAEKQINEEKQQKVQEPPIISGLFNKT